MTTLTDNAITILKKRYLARDTNGSVSESPEQMFHRVATHVAGAEESGVRSQWEEQFFNVMSDLEFLPNTPCLINAGRPLGMLSACFCLPLEDSLDEIFKTLQEAIMVQKCGGGTGFPLHHLRPKGDIVKSTGRTTSGPISFLKVFDASMEVIRQGGVRHGANMAVLRCDHPDIFEFIDCKSIEGTIRNFNISVGTTDRFIEAVKHNNVFDLINPRTGTVVKVVKARDLWKKIAEGAWRNGEPGVIYLDEINRHHPTPLINRIHTTNPCGEQGLPSYDSCNLGSINLNKVLKKHNDAYVIDYDRLGSLTETAVRFLDDVITVNKYPIPKIAEVSQGSRRIGLGIMGLADALLLMHIKYDSSEGVETSAKIMKCINDTAHGASRKLAEERGPFPICESSIYSNDPHRNATLTTIAPTGSISAIANCSSGCEPHFAITYEKHILDGEKLVEINHAFRRLAEEHGFWSQALIEDIMSEGGSVAKVSGVPDWAKQIVRVSSDVSAVNHIKMQAGLQLHVDNSISKTINAPQNITIDEVETVFMYAHEWGCRGLTFYRENSRSQAVLVKPSTNGKAETMAKIENKDMDPPGRPEKMVGNTHKVRTGYGNMYITVNRESKESPISEVFVTTSDTGGELRAWTEFASRIISCALRMGLPPIMIIKAGKHIRGPKPILDHGNVIASGPDAVARILETEIGETVDVDIAADRICPECGADMIMEEGCKKCASCGHSVCGG